jgi:hypothetical protein
VLLGYKSGLQALNGFFDEPSCFPFLEGLGLDPSPDRDRLLSLFDRPALHHYRELGRTLCAAIDLTADQQPDEVERTMTSCVRDVLNLTDDAATVRRWF